jgi:hypothetical protein
MLTTTGEVKVLDFGFAKIEMDETELVRVVELLSLGQPDDGPTAISQEPLFRLLGTLQNTNAASSTRRHTRFHAMR